MLEASAWTDAAFALIELELSLWTVRRLIFEDGAWFCSLTRQPSLPLELDETADAGHEVLPLAILLSFLQARRITASSPKTTVPVIKTARNEMLCCDNFA